MPCSLTVSPAHGLAFFRFWGVVTADEGRDAFIKYVEHPDFDPRYAMLSDARAVSNVDADFRTVMTKVDALTDRLRKFKQTTLSTVLVKNSVAFGMARMLGTLLYKDSNIRIAVTTSETEALESASVSFPTIDALTLSLGLQPWEAQ